ncbi:hypothetical protein BDD12DRAFT_886543 [Trichophaea hybrida]|nr:hypothetical protein BDD12DRAFT_886543 [Trichophaea hybrida]
MLSEDIIGALIHRISLDDVRNTITKAKGMMAKANGKRASAFDNEDISRAPPMLHQPSLPLSLPNYRNACCRTVVRSASSEQIIVVRTPPVGNSTPETTPKQGQVIGYSSSGDNIQAFIGPSSESFSITRAHSYVPLSGMIQGCLPFAEDDILMISTDRATTSWKALDSEVCVRVRDKNDTEKVYFKVAGQEEWESGTEDEEEFYINPNATLATNVINITSGNGRPPAQEASNAFRLDDFYCSLKLPKMDPPKWIVSRRGKEQARGRGRGRDHANGKSNIQCEIPSDGTGMNHGDTLDTTGNRLETSRTAVETTGIAVETFGSVNTSGTPVVTSGSLVKTLGTVYTSGTPFKTCAIPVETFETVDTSGTPVVTSKTSVETSATSVETSRTPAETTATPLETTCMPFDSCETSSDFIQLDSTRE